MKRQFAYLPLAFLAVTAAALPVQATIYGTMSNFDVFNDTPQDAYGAELDLEGVHSTDVINTYPSHFDHRSVTEYNNGTTFGTLVDFTGYNFEPSGFIAPTVGTTTNGHACVGTPGCEHFGFALSGNPTATRYYWLDQTSQRIGTTPMAVPTPIWTYYPPALPGQQPIVQAEVEVPKPENEVQQPDSIWMKVYETQLAGPAKLKELMSGNAVVPEDASQIETEWELLDGGVLSDAKGKVGEGKEAVVRRYEFFKYTGAYTAEHESSSLWNKVGDPPANELGDFIAANMVAANLVDVPVVPGDYNGDGQVDAADYTVWRDKHGSEVDTDVDGNHDGVVDQGDYDVWQGNFGNHAGAGALAAGGNAVPEPSTGVLAVLSSAILVLYRLRARRT